VAADHFLLPPPPGVPPLKTPAVAR
jgi:hypothetical protein